jgi:hypothetical protein
MYWLQHIFHDLHIINIFAIYWYLTKLIFTISRIILSRKYTRISCLLFVVWGKLRVLQCLSACFLSCDQEVSIYIVWRCMFLVLLILLSTSGIPLAIL